MSALFIVLGVQAQIDHQIEFAPCATEEDFQASINEPLGMLQNNIDDGDKAWAKLANLAATTAAIERYAKWLEAQLSPEDWEMLRSEVLASLPDDGEGEPA